MGVRFPSVVTNSAVVAPPANATEFAVMTTPPFSPPIDGGTVFIHWYMKFLTGTGTTAFIIQIRRGSGVAGVSINLSPATYGIGAAVNGILTGCYNDSPGVVAGQQYTLTCQQTGATAAGVWGDVAMFAYVL